MSIEECYKKHATEYLKFLANKGLGEDAKDIVQDAFVAAILQGISPTNIPNYIRGIVKNMAADFHKKRAKSPINNPNSDDIPEDIHNTATSPEEEIIKLERAAAMAKVVGFLEKENITNFYIIKCYDVDGLSHEEIAEDYGITKDSSKTLKARAIKQAKDKGEDLYKKTLFWVFIIAINFI